MPPMRYTTNDGENLNAVVMPEMKAALERIAKVSLRRLKDADPLPSAPGEKAPRHAPAHVYNAILAWFLDLPPEAQEAAIDAGWRRMIEVYRADTPRDLEWRAPPRAEGGPGDAGREGGIMPRASGAKTGAKAPGRDRSRKRRG